MFVFTFMFPYNKGVNQVTLRVIKTITIQLIFACFSVICLFSGLHTLRNLSIAITTSINGEATPPKNPTKCPALHIKLEGKLMG
jgi:hypothetical protein